MTEEILAKARQNMDQVILLLSEDLKGIKTGRAKPSLVEAIKVEAYATRMLLKELASITAPDFHSLVISPWDKTILKNIEKAIAISDLNLHPVVDNEIIRIQIPPLTGETRQDLVKLVHQKLESQRQLLRRERNETKKQIENLKGQPAVSEDNISDWLDKLKKLVEEYTLKIENLGKQKEQELMTI